MMRTLVALGTLGWLLSVPFSRAAEIEGTVTIKRRLTKRTVTAPSSAYSRGAAVPLSGNAVSDALAYERTHVVVYVEGGAPGQPETAVMEQRDRAFLPDLLVLAAGSSVSFLNDDPIFHNVFSLSKVASFDLGNYPKGQTRIVKFGTPGVVFVNCHLHPNMSSVIVVTPSHLSAVPDEAGRFVIHEVPPGEYTVSAWHKSAGLFQHRITVQDSKPARLDFFIPLDADAEPEGRRTK